MESILRIDFTKLLIGVVIILSSNKIAAQEFDSVAYRFANEIKAETLEKHLKVIASDEFEGRETGKAGQKKAMEYLINEFRSYGIEDFNHMEYRQSFPLIEQENKNIRLSINSIELVQFDDFLLRPFFVKNGKYTGRLELYSNQTEKKDKNFFIWEREEEENSASIKEQLAELKKGESKVVFYYDPALGDKLLKYGNYYKRSRTRLAIDQKEGAQIIVALSNQGLDKLLKAAKTDQKKLSKKGVKELEKNLPVQFDLIIDKPNNHLSGENVIAYIPGKKKPEELIVITAHYDHLGADDSLTYNGADDDGTGTVSVIEIAQSFMMAVEEGFGPDRSVLIMPVSGEEKGLLGSRFYSENPVFPLENTVANLNIDMVGRYDKNHIEDSNYIYLIGSDKLSKDLHEISEEVNEKYANFNLDYRYNDDKDPNRFYYRSDHYNFAKNNVPVIFYFSGVHEDYHQSTDTYEKIDYQKTARVARLVFLTAWELANREDRIRLIEDL